MKRHISLDSTYDDKIMEKLRARVSHLAKRRFSPESNRPSAITPYSQSKLISRPYTTKAKRKRISFPVIESLD